jgi:tetratricopeptide (TPR) repeat protein/predicted Ser/Thr protein kinase
MSERDSDLLDDSLVRGLARTPDVTPFAGTDRYRVCACLGEGGFGVVYEVEDRELGRKLALKTLKPQRSGFADNIQRLKREFRSVADLAHPNLVGLHELSTDGARWFFTMDRVRGCDFLEYVCGQTAIAYARTEAVAVEAAPPRRNTSGVLSGPRLRGSLRQLVAGVHALHQAGIVHRDLKPPNVLVEPDGRVVILDFGLAHSHFPDDPDILSAGTPVYMAPEQAAGEPVTGAADWYAVGVMLYEALTGTVPFLEADNFDRARATRDPAPPSEHASVPEDLEALCLALLRRDPRQRADAARILEMLGEGQATTVPAGGEPNAFVGRARELSALREGYAAIRRGHHALIRIHGQPGVGKSALLGRFRGELPAQDNAVVLAARCHERESVPFKGFDGVADALVGYLRGLPRNEASGLMPRDIHLVVQLFPVFEGVSAIRDVPRRHAPVADPREARLRAFAAIKELIARIADKQPLVIVIDDLQWGDVDSARLLSNLVAPPERPALLLVLCYRADEAETSPTLRETLRMMQASGERGTEIAVDPLPAEDAELLAAQLLGTEGTAAQTAARTIAQRAEGHPLFMAELARVLKVRDRDEQPLPSLIDTLWQRVVRLSDSARALLETVAMAGQPLSSSLCFEAAGLGGSGIDALRVLRAEQLVRAGDQGDINVFHDRIRDTVFQRADAATVRMRHLALARSLERAPDSDPEALARHFDAAEEREPAARYAAVAAEAAMEAFAFDRAASLYRMAIDRGGAAAPGSGALREKLAHALLNAGYNLKAGEAYLEAAASAEGDRAVDLERRAAELLLRIGDIEVGYEVLDRALAAVKESLPASLGRARFETMRHVIGMRLRGMRFRERDEGSIPPGALLRLDVLASAVKGLEPNDPPRSIAIAQRFARMALDLGEPRRAALGLMQAAFGLSGFRRARPPVVDEILDSAEAIGRRLSDHAILGEALLVRSLTHFAFGNWPRCAELGEQAAAILAGQCVGMADEHRQAVLNSAGSHLRCGRLVEARRLSDALLLDAIERGDPVVEKNVYLGGLAPLSMAADEPRAALDLLSRVPMENRCISVMLRAETEAAIHLYLGRPDDAVQAWRCRWSRLEEMGVLTVAGFRVIIVRSLATALLASRESPREVREAARWTRSIRRFRFPYAAAAHAGLRGCLALCRGKHARAASLFDHAAALYDEASMVLDAAAYRYRRGQLVGGDEGAALIAAAESELRVRGIVCPERWVATVVPDHIPTRASLPG